MAAKGPKAAKTAVSVIQKFPACIQSTAEGVKISVLAKPGAKHSRVTNIGEDGVGVQIAAPPVDGKANEELLEFLSEVLSVKKRQVSLDKGTKDRSKCVLVTETTPEYVHQKLSQAVEE